MPGVIVNIGHGLSLPISPPFPFSTCVPCREESLQEQLRAASASVQTMQRLHELSQSQLFEIQAQTGEGEGLGFERRGGKISADHPII